jgi:hypothetical protein
MKLSASLPRGAVFALLALASPAAATVRFENPGTVTGWGRLSRNAPLWTGRRDLFKVAGHGRSPGAVSANGRARLRASAQRRQNRRRENISWCQTAPFSV